MEAMSKGGSGPKKNIFDIYDLALTLEDIKKAREEDDKKVHKGRIVQYHNGAFAERLG
jgi:hypothetical protein